MIRKLLGATAVLAGVLTFAATTTGCVETTGQAAQAPAPLHPSDDARPRESTRDQPSTKPRSKDKRSDGDRDQPVTSGLVNCDANISAKQSTTSCEFAQNVFYSYWTNGGGTFKAYSPRSEQFYDVSCRGSSRIVCRAGDGAEIRFGAQAVALYDADQAADYAATHDLGPESGSGDSDVPPSAPEDGPEPSAACDPNYEGACLDPSSYDYDCESGEGDGPDYTGEVMIVGSDPHDLDRDGDGVACEPY